LKCLSPYRNREEIIPAGTIIEVDEARAAWLMRDAPGCFEEITLTLSRSAGDPSPIKGEGSKMLEEPPADKMIKPRQTRKK